LEHYRGKGVERELAQITELLTTVRATQGVCGDDALALPVLSLADQADLSRLECYSTRDAAMVSSSSRE